MTAPQSKKFEALALFGSPLGIKHLLSAIPRSDITAIIGAAIRPQYFKELKELASENSIPFLIQPKHSASEYSPFLEEFKKIGAKSIISHAYSMLLREDLLRSVNMKAANIHYALLPSHRGPNPLQWSLIHDDKETGTTLHLMNRHFDAGDIIAQKRTTISDTDTWTSLMEACHKLTLDLLKEEIPKLLQGEYVTRCQNEALSNQNSRLTPDSPKIDFSRMSDREVFNWIRAQVTPLPGAYFEMQGRRIHIKKFIPLGKISILRKRLKSGEANLEDLYD